MIFVCPPPIAIYNPDPPPIAIFFLRIARRIPTFAFEFLSYFSKNIHIRILLCSCINLYFFDFFEVYAHSPFDYLEEYLHSPLIQLIRDYHNKFSNRVVFVGPWWFGRAWDFVLVEHEIPFWWSIQIFCFTPMFIHCFDFERYICLTKRFFDSHFISIVKGKLISTGSSSPHLQGSVII